MASIWRGSKGLRKQIATILGALSITEPAALAMKKAYETPPATIQDLPCFVIYPPAVEVVQRGYSMREEIFTVRCLCLVKDADLDVAADLIDAFREAALDAFDGAATFADVPDAKLLGQRCGEASLFAYGGKKYSGFDCTLTFAVNQAREFSVAPALP